MTYCPLSSVPQYPPPAIGEPPKPPPNCAAAAAGDAPVYGVNTGFGKLAFVNGHGGQPQVLQVAARSARRRLYRLVGFAVLSLIVVVLVGYVGTSAFFFVDDHWIQPMVVSPTDPEVLALESELAEAGNAA